jgi:predicted nucleic acid-binding protein
MIHSPKFTAVLDACVLYPAPIRDLLLHIASFELFKPKWTDTIQDEWKRNLLINRPDLKEEQLQRTIDEMNKAFPDSNIRNYEVLISSLKLPDKDDRHVLASAIRCNADVIVTSNLKDFPTTYLQQFDIEPQHPDPFISSLIDLNPDRCLSAFHRQVSFLKNPPLKAEQVLIKLESSGLIETAKKLKTLGI